MSLKYAIASAETNQAKGDAIYESKETLSSVTTGSDILLPAQGGRFEAILVALVLTGTAQGKLQFTVSNYADVVAGTATWFDWDAGVVAVNTNDVLFHATGVRVVETNAGGGADTATIEARWV